MMKMTICRSNERQKKGEGTIEIKADLEMLESFGINSVEMHDRLIGYLEELLNYRQAERDGRLVVLPHPIGCKVYTLKPMGVLKGMIREVTVAGYSEKKVARESKFRKRP